MPLLDTHCHIDLYPDYVSLIDEIEQMRTVTIAVTNTPSVFTKCQAIIAGKQYLRAALGLHPELAHIRSPELILFKELLGNTRFVGEIGLDYVTQDEAIRAVQRQVFGEILSECAKAKQKILTVHSRRAANEVVEMVGQGFPGIVILHWFSGSKKIMEKALAYGMYFSVNPAMVQSEAGRKIVDAIPLERLLTETDGPFVRKGNVPVHPIDVQNVISYLSGNFNIDEQEMAETVYTNFRNLIRLK